MVLIYIFHLICLFFFFQAEDGIRDAQESRGLGDVYKRQLQSVLSKKKKSDIVVTQVLLEAIDCVKRGEYPQPFAGQQTASTTSSSSADTGSADDDDVSGSHLASIPLLMGVLTFHFQHFVEKAANVFVPILEVVMAVKVLSARVAVGPSLGYESTWYKSVLGMIQVVVAKALALKDRGGLALDCGSTTLLEIAERARMKLNHHRHLSLIHI
eukprot:TRINITY_DN9345_c0_g1_i1.p1 TRINITY_DN9345_c0_g1~~TRINITY_DN9345_c0_g1_i1.p1  ORF type:complete len:212 (-),score=42.61 TRINITY_DN9345_c0_g1_i1:68-703(-)